MRILLINSSIGNVRSISSMLRRIGHRCEMIDRPVPLSPDDKLILPGVGAFDAGTAALKREGLDEFVVEAATLGCDILGICLGMQLLCEGSEEGSSAGLGLVPATVKRLPVEEHGLRIPHMGWNVVRPVGDRRLFALSDEEQRFYFVHSYYVDCRDQADVAAVTGYGIDFACSFERGNIMGVQFHPEKSHKFGMRLLSRFVGDEPS